MNTCIQEASIGETAEVLPVEDFSMQDSDPKTALDTATA